MFLKNERQILLNITKLTKFGKQKYQKFNLTWVGLLRKKHSE